jgi:hypothetical protein
MLCHDIVKNIANAELAQLSDSQTLGTDKAMIFLQFQSRDLSNALCENNNCFE